MGPFNRDMSKYIVETEIAIFFFLTFSATSSLVYRRSYNKKILI